MQLSAGEWNEVQENRGGGGMATTSSVSATAPAIAGGPSPHSTDTSTVKSPTWNLEVLTLNINSWATFKERWANEGEPADI